MYSERLKQLMYFRHRKEQYHVILPHGDPLNWLDFDDDEDYLEETHYYSQDHLYHSLLNINKNDNNDDNNNNHLLFLSLGIT